MSYRDHIEFSSLDEARRHQRGEAVGKPFKQPRKPRVTREYAKLTDEMREEVALSTLPVKETAELYNIRPAQVSACRRQLGTARQSGNYQRAVDALERRT